MNDWIAVLMLLGFLVCCSICVGAIMAAQGGTGGVGLMSMIQRIRKWHERRFPSQQRFNKAIVDTLAEMVASEAWQAGTVLYLVRSFREINPPSWLFHYRLRRLERAGVLRSWEGPQGERVYALPVKARAKTEPQR